MLAIWDKWGVRYPVTVLHLDSVQVIQVKTESDNGYTALQLGIGEAKIKRVNKPLLGHYKSAAAAATTVSTPATPELASSTLASTSSMVVNRKLMEFKVNAP